MKAAAYITGLAGLGLAIALIVLNGYHGILAILMTAGWSLLWLVPYHFLPIGLDATGWWVLLRPVDPYRDARLPFLWWVAAVRDAVAGLLPVARIGGELVGARLVALRRLSGTAVIASVIVELCFNLVTQYLFTLFGLALVLSQIGASPQVRDLVVGLLIGLPLLVLLMVLLRFGSIFERLGGLLWRITGARGKLAEILGESVTLDDEVKNIFHRWPRLLICGCWQLAALVVGAGEIWIAMRLLGHPIDASASILLESLSQALRSLAFVVPAGLGVQEAGFVIFGQMVGLTPELGVALSLSRRFREVVFGVPVLISWQWFEGRRLGSFLGRK